MLMITSNHYDVQGGMLQWAQESFDDVNLMRLIITGPKIEPVKNDQFVSWLLLGTQMSVSYHCNNRLSSTFVPSIIHRTQGISLYQKFRCTVLDLYKFFFFSTPFSIVGSTRLSFPLPSTCNTEVIQRLSPLGLFYDGGSSTPTCTIAVDTAGEARFLLL